MTDIKIITKTETDLIRMQQLKPGQVAIITDPRIRSDGCMVMRTLSDEKIEVMNLSTFGPGECWVISTTSEVEVRPINVKITIEEI